PDADEALDARPVSGQSIARGGQPSIEEQGPRTEAPGRERDRPEVAGQKRQRDERDVGDVDVELPGAERAPGATKRVDVRRDQKESARDEERRGHVVSGERERQQQGPPTEAGQARSLGGIRPRPVERRLAEAEQL